MTLFARSRQHRPSPGDLVIDALAVARLSRLVTTDTFPPVADARARLTALFPQDGQVLDDGWEWALEPGEEGPAVRPWGVGPFRARSMVMAHGLDASGAGHRAYTVGDHPVGELLQCRWCCSVWLAAGVVVLSAAFPRAWRPVSRLLAFSQVAGLLSLAEER